MMVYNFFGGEISDTGYVEGNIEYSEDYKRVLNNNITINNNGYIPLSRILYFYNENTDLSFDEIYENNLDIELNTMMPISDVCQINYSDY